MKAEVKAEWIKRLRSGEYKQGMGALKHDVSIDSDTTTYCCLGVLCEVAVDEGIVKRFDPKPQQMGEASNYGVTKNDATTGVPPREVLDWVEIPKIRFPSGVDVPNDEFQFTLKEDSALRERIEGYYPDQRDFTLVELNDSGKFTFEEIATLIEEHF